MNTSIPENWMQTYTGRAVDIFNLKPDDVDIRDIAHALALKCRFGGHVKEFYCEADHAVRVARLLEPQKQIYALLYAAPAAYLPGFLKPFKAHFAAQFDTGEIPIVGLEDQIRTSVLKAFGLSIDDLPRSVAVAGLTLLATEARDLMSPPPAPWDLDVPVLPKPISPLSWQRAEKVYLEMFAACCKRMNISTDPDLMGTVSLPPETPAEPVRRSTRKPFVDTDPIATADLSTLGTVGQL